MKVTMMLADAAQEVGGKLYILGGGWSHTGPGPFPWALAIKVEVPWDEANTRKEWTLTLLDEDGHPVAVPGHEGPLQLKGEFEVGRPPGLKKGAPIDMAIAIQSLPILLPGGRRYVFHLAIEGSDDNHWEVSFFVRSPRMR